MKTAVVTVSNNKFIKGVLVLFYSFIKHNAWFDGDLVVVSDGLSEKNIHMLKSMLEHDIKVVNAGGGICQHVDALSKHVTHLKNKASRFYSIEAFGMTEYDKVLFLDSDMLCVGDMSELMKDDYSGLTATHDGSYYNDMARHRETYQKVSPAQYDDGAVHDKTFNAGMMVISGKALSDETYRGILSYIDVDHWQGVIAKNADQIPLNKYFDGSMRLVDSRYNFRFSIAEKIIAKDGIANADIRMYHYTGKLKPWNLFVESKLRRKNLWLRLDATKLWKDYYRELRSIKT